MKKGLREIIIIFLTTGLALGSLGYLTAKEITNYATSFGASGYILDTSDSSSGALVNQQYYFNQGEAYSNKNSSDKISFMTVNGDSVSVDPACFIHYTDNSMASFAKTVILDTDNVSGSNISYYSLSKESLLQKQGDTYIVNSAVDPLQLKNFIWKISESQYMIVSDTITLHVDENSYQRFNEYIQVQYKDSGVAYIVNQEGTYSTVSSDAYLELANGIRVYLGSKNVTDDEGILLSLAQMVVNSEDNIEIIPDEEFKKEKDTEPRIVVEANDGADGEAGAPGKQGGIGKDGTAGAAGEAGISGEDGEGGADGVMGADGAQGKTGATGQAGAPGVTGTTGKAGRSGKGGTPGTEGNDGNDGDSSDTAGVIYVKNEDPEYEVSIVPSTYGMVATVKYSLNGSVQTNEQMEATYVYIRNSATGKVVWRKTDIGTAWTPSGTEITCDTLSADTNYTFCISACYTNALDENIVDEIVLTRLFATESIGLKLKSRYVTDKVIAVDLQKNVENNIKSVTCVVTDTNDNFIGFLEPADSNADLNLVQGVDPANPTTFDVNQISVGATVSLAISGLEPDTTYKVQLRLVDYTLESGLSVSPSDANAFPAMTLKTLRTAPTLGKPEVSISQISKSFIISPKDITDPHNGITSYTYDIYNATAVSAASGSNLSFSEEPVLSLTSDSPKSIKVRVDEATLISGKNYIARVVAHFNNNTASLDYSSPLSDVFSYDPNLAWPSGSNTIDSFTASSLEGRVTITDTNGTAIPRDENDYLTVCIAPVLQELKNNGTMWDAGDMVELTRISTENFMDNRITIPYEAVALKQNTRYTIYVVASRLRADDQYESDVVLFTENVSTGMYDPITMNIHDETPIGEEIFSEYIQFYPQNKSREDQKTGQTSSIWGDMSNISGKAMGYVEFYLYDGDLSAGDLSTRTPIGRTVRLVDEKNGMIGYALRRNVYSFDYNMTLVDGGTTKVVKAYDPDSTTADPLYGFKLTASDFGDPINDDEYGGYFQSLHSKFVIKAKVYDYTYGTDATGSKSLWRDAYTGPYYNPIPSAKKVDGTYSYEFTAEFSLTAAFPSWQTVRAKSSYSEVTYKNLGSDTSSEVTLYRKLKGNVDADQKVASNYPTVASDISAIDKIYKGSLQDATSIGVRFSGPSAGIVGASEQVQYSVYSTVTGYSATDGANTGTCAAISADNLLVQSEWLEVKSNKFPDYYFLVDASLGRGHEFYIVTTIKLTSGYGGYKYPDDFYAANLAAATPEDAGIGGNGKDVDGFLCTRFCLNRQAPTVKVVQDTATAGGSVTYLFTFKDFDKALVGSTSYDGTNGEEIYFFSNSDFERTILGNKSSISATAIPQTGYTENVKSIFPYKITNVSSSATWGLKWTKTDLDRTYQLLQIDPYASVLEAKSPVTILTKDTETMLKDALASKSIPNSAEHEDYGVTAFFGDNPLEQKGKLLTIQYYFFADQKTDFLTSDIHFRWGVAPDGIDYTLNLNLSEYTEVSDSATYVTVDYPSGSKTFSIFRAKIVLDLQNYPELVALPGKSNISVTVKVYSETGKYGISYVKGGKYFSIQKRAEAGSRYVAKSSVYTVATPGTKESIFLGGYNTLDGTIPGCYQFLLTSNLAKYNYIEDNSYKAMESSYSAEGLMYIPREVSAVESTKADLQAPSGPVLNMQVEVIPGYSSAVMNISLDKTNTNVDFTNRMVIFYAEYPDVPNVNPDPDPLTGSYDYLVSKTHEQNAKVFAVTTDVLEEFQKNGVIYKSSLTIPSESGTVLKSNTRYKFKVFVDTDKTHDETFQYNELVDKTHPRAEQFTTLERVDAVVTNLEFRADANGSKTATVTYQFNNVQWSFFDDSADNAYKVLEAAYLVIRQESGSGLATVVSGNLVDNIIGEVQSAFPANLKQSGDKASFVLQKSFSWSPSADHVMNGNTSYYAELVLAYVGGHVDLSDKSRPYMNGTLLNGLLVSDPSGYSQLRYERVNVQPWSTGTNSTLDYLSIVPSSYYDYTMGTSVLTFSASGADMQCIFNRNGSGAVSYSVTLLENNSPVPLNTVDITKSVVGGSITPVVNGTYKFTGLDESTNKYRLLVTCAWDNNNDGVMETGLNGYTYSTGNLQIPGASMNVSSVYINANLGSQVVVLGTNLEQVTSISYQLYVNSGVTSIESGTVDVSNGNPRWTTDPNSPGSYNFKLDTNLNPSNTYQLDIVIKSYKPDYNLDNEVKMSQWWRPSASAGTVAAEGKDKLFNRVVAKITDFFKN